ncbi:MAG: DUF2332 family protein [Acidimicrobiales bacterium]|jgi:hypothetical protein
MTRELADLWIWFAATQCGQYSPLYDRVCRAVAESDETLDIVQAAPPQAHVPNVLLAAVHYLVLAGLDDPLADVYAGRSEADPGPLFVDVCRANREAIAALLATRHTNTNEVGRSAVLGPALTDAGESGSVALVTTDSGSKWVHQALPAQLNYLVALTCPLVNYCQAGGTSLAGGGVLATYVAAPLVLTTAKLPTAKLDKSFSARLAASGGAGSYTWIRSAGALPKGLVLSSGGVISGKPTKKGIGSFSVEVRDGLGHTATKKFKLTVT